MYILFKKYLKKMNIFLKCYLEFFIHSPGAHFFSGGPEHEDRDPQWIGTVRSLGVAKVAIRRMVV